MIELTRLNGHPITVNSDLIKFVESIPDTVLSLINGERLIVRETTAEVVQRITEFRVALLHPDPSSLSRPNGSISAA